MAAPSRITTLAENGPPPSEAAAIYAGEVMHARLKPFGHRFTYSVFSMLVDLDRLEEAGQTSALFSVNRPGVLSFHDADHAERPGETARAYADRLIEQAGVARPKRIMLLAYPRLFGYVFNPISVYFAYDDKDDLVAVIYGVRNTFGERHSYVAPIRPGELTEAGLRQTRTKIFHVSPFIDMGARYDFRLMPPGRTVRLRIHESEAGEPLLSATFRGDARPLGTAVLLGLLLKIPVLTWKIAAGIHWEALKLWMKGARFHKAPPPPPPASSADEGAGTATGELAKAHPRHMLGNRNGFERRPERRIDPAGSHQLQ